MMTNTGATETEAMIDSTGGGAGAGSDLAAAIDALGECEQASNACAMAMVTIGGMVSEVHRALDCADVCESTRRVLSRGADPDPRVVDAVVEASVVACEASAAACEAHAGHHTHCRLHSATAHRCAQALRALSKTSG